WNVELLGGDLLKRGLKPLADLGLAGEGGDAAIGVDPDPGIEERRLLQAARKRWCGLVLRKRAAQRKAHDQRAGAGQHAAAIENEGGVHRAPPSVVAASAHCISAAARCTARR